jgi:hypothetical protein
MILLRSELWTGRDPCCSFLNLIQPCLSLRESLRGLPCPFLSIRKFRGLYCESLLLLLEFLSSQCGFIDLCSLYGLDRNLDVLEGAESFFKRSQIARRLRHSSQESFDRDNDFTFRS